MASWRPEKPAAKGREGIEDYLKRQYPNESFTTKMDLRTKKLTLLDFPSLSEQEMTELINLLKIQFPETF